MTYKMQIDSPIGRLCLVGDDALTHLCFAQDLVPPEAVEQETPLFREAVRQLEAYFAGNLTQFTLPLHPAGTEFMQQVWHALTAIPYGETRNYGQVAAAVGNPKAARAVGLANNRNPIPIVIPCHRVIGANKQLTGYRGGLAAKQYLLELEAQHANLCIR